MRRTRFKVPCEIRAIELDGDFGPVASVQTTCTRCGHTTRSYGDHKGSIKRCLVVMREECPEGEENFYVADEDD